MKEIDQKTRVKAKRALDFLRSHPALDVSFSDNDLFPGSWFDMGECCKRGIDKGARQMLSVYRGSKGWEKFKDKFEKEYKDDNSIPHQLQNIHVKYEDMYGEKWKFDHVEYWYETVFFVFDGDVEKQNDDWDHNKWLRYQGVQGGANSFEEAMINCARTFKKHFGNFNSYDSFLTDEEIENHEHNNSFNFKPLKDGYSQMITNPDYINVSDGKMNLRWLKWFIETDYCKKNWDWEIPQFKKILKRNNVTYQHHEHFTN